MEITKQIAAIRFLQKFQAEAIARLGNAREINPTLIFLGTEIDRLIAQLQAAIIEGNVELKMVIFLLDQAPLSKGSGE